MSETTSMRATKRPGPGADAGEIQPTSANAEFRVPPTSIHRVEADGVRVFYRAAGDLAGGSVVSPAGNAGVQTGQQAGEVQLRLSDIPKFLGKPGMCGAKWAVQLTESISA